jgi:small subunit ribosomal protein S1
LTTDPHQQPAGASSAESERPGDMAALLEESLEYRSPQRGDIVEGVVMGWDRDGLYVDIGAKSEGVVPRNEMQSLGPNPESRLGAGENVLVFIIQPDAAEGQILLSLDRARGEQGWHVLQERFDSGEAFEAIVSGYNKGGLLVNVEGVNAFVPLSQVVGFRPERGREDGGGLAEAVGKTLRLKVIEINRRRNRVILSERAALQEWRMQQKERLIQELREGDIRRGRISSVRSFGVFVDLGGADGLAHLSELSWDRERSPGELFNVGDEVDVYITKIDAENKKIALSLRRANPSQWDAVVERYQEGQVVTGLVTKLVTFGAFARIEGPVEGLIHVSELVDRRIGHPKEVVREGDLLPLKIVRIERDRHRLGLSLRRARDEGQGLGYVFSEGGEVLSVPEAIRAEFEAREGPIEVQAPRDTEETPQPKPEAAEPLAEVTSELEAAEPLAEVTSELEAAEPLDEVAAAEAAEPLDEAAPEPIAEAAPEATEAPPAPEQEPVAAAVSASLEGAPAMSDAPAADAIDAQEAPELAPASGEEEDPAPA